MFWILFCLSLAEDIPSLIDEIADQLTENFCKNTTDETIISLCQIYGYLEVAKTMTTSEIVEIVLLVISCVLTLGIGAYYVYRKTCYVNGWPCSCCSSTEEEEVVVEDVVETPEETLEVAVVETPEEEVNVV